jgi:hypothetical protein
MAQKQTIELPRLTKQSAVRDLAAQLAGKKRGGQEKTWIQTFAASGGKQGGKTSL